MDSLRLMIEAARADQALAAHTTDQDLQTVIARERPDLREALASNPSTHPDLRAWLADQGVEVTAPAIAGAQATSVEDQDGEDAEDTQDAEGSDLEDTAVVEAQGAEADASEDAVVAEDVQDDAEAEDESDEPASHEADEQPEPESADAPEGPESGGESGSEELEREDDSESDSGPVDEDAPEVQGAEPEASDAEAGDAEDDAEAEGGAGALAPEDVEDRAFGEAEDQGTENVEDTEGAEGTDLEDTAVVEVQGAAPDVSEDTEDAEDVQDDAEAEDESEEPASHEADEQPESEPADESEDPETTDQEDEDGESEAEASAAGDSSGSAGSADSIDSTEAPAPSEVDETREWDSADSAQEAGLPAPPPSAEDIAAWAETPDRAPETYAVSAHSAAGSAYAYSPAYAAVPQPLPPLVQQPLPPALVQPQPQPKADPQPSRGSTTKLIACIVVLLLIIVGGGGVIVGSYLSKDEADTQAGGTESSSADPTAASTASAVSNPTATGQITSCNQNPSITIKDVEDEVGSLTAQVHITPACDQGDFLDGSQVRIDLYGPSTTNGSGSPNTVVASGEFDFSGAPLIIPTSGVVLDLTYGEGHYFRTAEDLRPSGGGYGSVMKAEISMSRGSTATLSAQGLSSPGGVTAAETSSSSVVEDQAASDGLEWYIDRDRDSVRFNLTGFWTPQLSSKRPGLVAEGRTWDERSALAEFLMLRQKHPKARLVNSDEWPVFEPGGGWWVTLAGETFVSADNANAWCDAQGYDADHCLAKKMDVTGPPDGTTVSR